MGFISMFKARGRCSKEISDDISALNAAIDLLNIAKDTVEIIPVKGVFGSTVSLLALIRDKMINERDFVQLAKDCSHLCNSLKNGVQGGNLESLTAPVKEAIDELNDTIRDIEREVVEHANRGWWSRLFHAKYDREKVQGWKLDFQKTLGVFNAALNLNGKTPDLPQLDHGESPPPAPRNIVGRNELIEKAVCLINTGSPIALIGAGGIGKTSIALKLLEDSRIKERFGNNRRFIRCDEVHSYSHFISRLSKVTGAKPENASGLTALRPFLSSVDIFLILDNAETILDPRAPEAPALYSAVEELSRIKTVSLFITTRISTIPIACQQLEVSALSISSAREVFYNIFANQQRTPDLDVLLRRLDCHPLSITLLATVATQNRWDSPRLLREWEKRRISLLSTRHTLGLSTAVELSLSSPTFTSLGPGARDILGVIAILPQGINESELEWIFPSLSNAHEVVDTFCILSLTHRDRGFVTMLAPFREYLKPDGHSSHLFSSVRNQYLTRIRNTALDFGHGLTSPQEMQWFVAEEVNIDFLLVLSLTIDPNSVDIQRIRHAAIQISRFHNPRATLDGKTPPDPI